MSETKLAKFLQLPRKSFTGTKHTTPVNRIQNGGDPAWVVSDEGQLYFGNNSLGKR
jgi:hypothetical protein